MNQKPHSQESIDRAFIILHDIIINQGKGISALLMIKEQLSIYKQFYRSKRNESPPSP